MACKRKQTTLFKYNFKRKVEHKGTLIEIKRKDSLDNESVQEIMLRAGV